MLKRILLLVFVLLVLVSAAQGQVLKTRKVVVKKGWLVKLRDTTFITRRDTVIKVSLRDAKSFKVTENPYNKSSQFYDSLEKRAGKGKMSKNIFSLIFKKKKRKEKLLNVIVKSEDVFKPFEGMIVSTIVFKAVDLLEGSVTDTLQKASSRFGIFVNKVHRDTRASIIQQNLLFEVGDRVDAYLLADNERVLRQFITLRDARIYVSNSLDHAGEVDVIIVTQDVASIGAAGSYGSLQRYRLDVYDINILGYARQLQLSYFRNAVGIPKNGFEVRLRDPNFFGTFMQGQLQYTNNYLRERTLFTLGRDFFTPEIKYAGGVELYRTNENFYFEEYDTLQLSYTENSIDFWAGRSFQFEKRKNIILSGRTNTRNFISTPFISADSNAFFYDRTLFLGSLSLTKRNFLKSLRIRGFGKTEDVPTGGSISLVAGREVNVFADRAYLELDATFGKYFKRIGYLNLSLAVGSFFKRGPVEDGLVSLNGTYFSDLMKIRRAQLRQFLYFTYINGFNRILDQTISVRGKWRADNTPPLGNQRMTLGLESVYFMPWYTYGFQFALFYRFDFNLLSQETALQKFSNFMAIRGGARMLNENLVLPRLSIEISYYIRNQQFPAAWEVRFSTSLINLFGTSQAFRPQVTAFN